MDIDAYPPAIARSELEIDASPEAVWEVLADVPSWPRWNPDVKSASLDGPFAAGTTFRWKAGPGTITSTLQEVERPVLMGWTGRTLGIEAIHVYRLVPRGSSTLVTSEESWNGALSKLFRGRMTRMLQSSLDAALARLQAQLRR